MDQMLEEGLLEEVKGLREEGCHRGMVSMQGLGYKDELHIWMESIPWKKQSGLAETRYSSFCKKTADLVSQRTGSRMGGQRQL